MDNLSDLIPTAESAILYKLFALLLVVTITGCATPGISLTVTSSPDGAYITSGGAVSGIVPVEAFWDKQQLERSSRDANGCFLLGGFTARWASGAVTEVPVLRHCGKTNGHYNFVMPRNMNSPGLDQDLQFSLQVQAIRAQNAQAAAAQSAAAAAQSAAFAALWSASTAAQQAQKPVQCSTYNVGMTIQTKCQ